MLSAPNVGSGRIVRPARIAQKDWVDYVRQGIATPVLAVSAFSETALALRRVHTSAMAFLDAHGTLHTAALCGGVAAFPRPIPIVPLGIRYVAGANFKTCAWCKDTMKTGCNPIAQVDLVDLQAAMAKDGHPGFVSPSPMTSCVSLA